MKRHCSLCIAVLLLLTSLLCVLPVHAATDFSFATLDYVLDAVEGEEPEESAHVSDKMEFERAVTITWNREAATLTVDGEAVTGESLHLEEAGRYRLRVKKIGAPDYMDYEVYVLPVINMKNGQVFTEYPTIECENAQEMNLDVSIIKDMASGTQIRTLGAHTLQIKGVGGWAWDYKFYVKLCHAVPVFDEALGKYALKVTVGAFDDIDSVVKMDGSELPTGDTLITAVGHHSVSATANGVEVTNLHALPSAEELTLRVTFFLPEKLLEEPVKLLLSRYDGNFFLLSGYDEETGEYTEETLVEGDLRITTSGKQALVARDADGNEIPYVFLVQVNEEDEGTTMTRIELEFDNPHNTYVIFLIPLAVLMLGAVAWFFVKRRRIV